MIIKVGYALVLAAFGLFLASPRPLVQKGGQAPQCVCKTEMEGPFITPHPCLQLVGLSAGINPGMCAILNCQHDPCDWHYSYSWAERYECGNDSGGGGESGSFECEGTEGSVHFTLTYEGTVVAEVTLRCKPCPGMGG